LNGVKDFPEDLTRSCINKTKYVMESFLNLPKYIYLMLGLKLFL